MVNQTPRERYQEYLDMMLVEAEEMYEEEARFLPDHPGETFEERRKNWVSEWMREFALDFEPWCRQEGIKAF